MTQDPSSQLPALRAALAASPDALAHTIHAVEALAASRPDDAWLRAQIGGVFDANGFEQEACRWYELALAFGVEALPPDQAPHLFVWYGSTLRNVGRLADSETTLRAALDRWPAFAALQFFLALTLMSQQRHAAAICALARLHAGGWDDSLRAYQRAVASYIEEELEPAAARQGTPPQSDVERSKG